MSTPTENITTAEELPTRSVLGAAFERMFGVLDGISAEKSFVKTRSALALATVLIAFNAEDVQAAGPVIHEAQAPRGVVIHEPTEPSRGVVIHDAGETPAVTIHDLGVVPGGALIHDAGEVSVAVPGISPRT